LDNRQQWVGKSLHRSNEQEQWMDMIAVKLNNRLALSHTSGLETLNRSDMAAQLDNDKLLMKWRTRCSNTELVDQLDTRSQLQYSNNPQ